VIEVLAVPSSAGGAASPVLVVAVACFVACCFVFFGLRAARIMRERPSDASEFLRKWFGKE
jgi:hypothetical protein